MMFKAKKPLVSVIIVNWNKRDMLEKCIRSLESQTCNDFEIIVVDNNSSDASAEMVRKKFPKVRLVESNRNLGFSRGCELGFKQARGRHIALLNNDVVVHREWLSALLKEIEAGAAAAGGMVRDKATGKIASTWIKMHPIRALPLLFTRKKPRAEVDYLPGCAFLMNGEAIKKIGFLDTSYTMYYEETDWCARAIRAGLKIVYTPDAVVFHDESSSIGRHSAERNWHLLASRMRFAIKNFSLKHLLMLLAFFPVETMAAVVLRRSVFSSINSRREELRARLSSLWWNIIHLPKTLEARRKDSLKCGNLRSYNDSLPLLREKWSRGE